MDKIFLIALLIVAVPITLLVGSIALTMFVSSFSSGPAGGSEDVKLMNALCMGLQEESCGSIDPDGEQGKLTAGNCAWNPVQKVCEGNP